MGQKRKEDVLKDSQGQYTNKADARPPTVSIEAMMMSCGIDSKEGKYVVVKHE